MSQVVLRDYQMQAVDTLMQAVAAGEHPVCGAATGAGKSLIIAELCRRLPGRILVATHRKELLAQNNAQLQRLLGDDIGGIYSAGIGRRDTQSRVIFGGIQSIYRRMGTLQQPGDFAYVLCDECHLCPPRSMESMYRAVFEACPGAQRLGLSATPYRLDGGPIYGHDEAWFTSMPVDIGVTQLTEQGYLAPLVGIQAATDIDLSKVRTRQGDYVLSDLSQVMADEQRVKQAVDEIATLAAHRVSWLAFCCDVTHTAMVTQEMQRRGILARMVVGSTPQEERDTLLADFRAGRFRCLVNCQVATTGFDIPQIDAVILLRPTQSKGLLVQMLGRGTRLKPQGGDCVILDYADTLERHMPLEEIPRLRKTERVEAHEAEKAREAKAREEKEHARHLASLAELEGRAAVTYKVAHMTYKLTRSGQFRDKQNLMVTYVCPERKPSKWLSTWLCPEYAVPFVRAQAESWFERRGASCPTSAASALRRAMDLPIPETIIVDERKKFPRVVMEHMRVDDIPPWQFNYKR